MAVTQETAEALIEALSAFIAESVDEDEAPAKPAAKKAPAKKAPAKAAAKAPAKKAPAKKAAPVVEEEDEDDEEETTYDRDEIKGKTLAALKKLAKEAGFDPDEIADADKDTLLDALCGDSEDEDDDEEEDDEEEDDEEEEEAEDEDDEEPITEEYLQGLTLADLRELADEMEVSYKSTAKKPAIIAAIMELAEDE